MVAGNVKYIPVAIHKVVSDSGIAEKKSKNASQAFEERLFSVSRAQSVCVMCFCGSLKYHAAAAFICALCAAEMLLAAPRSHSLHSRQIKCRSAQFESQHPITLLPGLTRRMDHGSVFLVACFASWCFRPCNILALTDVGDCKFEKRALHERNINEQHNYLNWVEEVFCRRLSKAG